MTRKPKLLLPHPDQYGNYWLDRSHKNVGHMPAIFPSKFIDHEGVVRHRGTFILTLGVTGFVFDGTTLKRFAGPEEALREYGKLTEVCEVA